MTSQQIAKTDVMKQEKPEDMCLGFPGKIISIDENKLAIIDISGTRREARLDLIDDDAAPGDYVICHAGYAIHRIDEELAREMLDCLKQLIESEPR